MDAPAKAWHAICDGQGMASNPQARKVTPRPKKPSVYLPGAASWWLLRRVGLSPIAPPIRDLFSPWLVGSFPPGRGLGMFAGGAGPVGLGIAEGERML